MTVREYEPQDCAETTELFYNTVHTVNAKDYTKEQLDAWATGKPEPEQTVPENIVTRASITAKPFFEKRGYQAVNEQTIQRQGILFSCCIMEKHR